MGNAETNVGGINGRIGNAEANRIGNGREKLEELINQLKLYWLKFKY